MPIDFTLDPKGDVLWVNASSDFFTFEEAYDYIKAIGETALKEGVSKIFCDETQLTHRLELAETFELAAYSASLAKGSVKVVLLCHESLSQAIQLYENATVNRGLNLKITSNRDEAETWLFG